uniref:PAW domain-containing protein n=1 Tax=Panagrolaimus davidi TaxID=227884 RepID=A0A914PZ85_9BILA
MVLKPTVNEIKAKCFEFTYNSVTDKYCRKYDDGSSSKGFESFTVSQNIMRKIEKDWKKAYLCRNKGCEKGEITWKIYFNGLKPKSIMIICEEPYKIKGGNISGSYYFNAEYLELHMEFMGGTGSNAYQYAQLFRCDLSNTRPNLLIHIEFE